MPRKPSEKQKNFARKYIELGNATEAYKQSYNAANMSVKAIQVESSRLLENPMVALCLQELQSKAAEAHDISIEWLTQKYMGAIQMAEELKKPGDITNAVTALGKMHGFIIDRSKMNVSDDRSDNEAESISPLASFISGAIGHREEDQAEKPLPN